MFVYEVVIGIVGAVGVVMILANVLLWADNRALMCEISKLNCDVVLLRENKHILEDKLSKFKCDVAISQEANSPKG